jgi:hypothetical protein
MFLAFRVGFGVVNFCAVDMPFLGGKATNTAVDERVMLMNVMSAVVAIFWSKCLIPEQRHSQATALTFA